MPHRSQHFLDFIKSLEALLAGYPKNETAFQEAQVNGLVAAEREFRGALMRHHWGWDVYDAFIQYIMVEKHNILMARPFFRERDVTFKAEIAQAIREPKHNRRLPRFDINYQFVNFALKSRVWAKDPSSKKLVRLAHRVFRLREEIIECNLPLAIFYARKFYSHNRASHHDYMDMVQVASGGLAAGVDKFAGPYTTGFRGVLIGRIVGDLIEANSETFVHFFPGDKRRLYRLRKIAAGLREGISDIDLDTLTKLLNNKEGETGDKQTGPSEVHHLVNAATIVAASTLPISREDEEEATSPVERYPDSAEGRPDSMLESAQTRRSVAEAIATLPLLDQKLLRLRGLDLGMVGA